MSVTLLSGGYDSFARNIFGVQHCGEIAAHCERPGQFEQVRDFAFDQLPAEQKEGLLGFARALDDAFGHRGW